MNFSGDAKSETGCSFASTVVELRKYSNFRISIFGKFCQNCLPQLIENDGEIILIKISARLTERQMSSRN